MDAFPEADPKEEQLPQLAIKYLTTATPDWYYQGQKEMSKN